MDRSVVDAWVKTDDKHSLIMARRLVREEGLLVGGSCGACLSGALQALKGQFKEFNMPGKRCVVVFPDSVRNYMSKFISDAWMLEEGFVEHNSKIGVQPKVSTHVICVVSQRGYSLGGWALRGSLKP